MKGLELKIVVYLARVRSWKTDWSPWLTEKRLAEHIGASGRPTKKALVSLGSLGMIRTKTDMRMRSFQLVFEDPLIHADHNCLQNANVEREP